MEDLKERMAQFKRRSTKLHMDTDDDDDKPKKKLSAAARKVLLMQRMGRHNKKAKDMDGDGAAQPSITSSGRRASIPSLGPAPV